MTLDPLPQPATALAGGIKGKLHVQVLGIADLTNYLILAAAFCWALRSLQHDADRRGDA